QDDAGTRLAGGHPAAAARTARATLWRRRGARLPLSAGGARRSLAGAGGDAGASRERAPARRTDETRRHRGHPPCERTGRQARGGAPCPLFRLEPDATGTTVRRARRSRPRVRLRAVRLGVAVSG